LFCVSLAKVRSTRIYIADGREWLGRQALHALMDGLTRQWLRARLGFDLVAAWDHIFAALFCSKGGWMVKGGKA